MASTAEQVSSYLDEDLALKEILARGVLNLRRAARWIIEKEDWDATEEAVVSALRRYGDTSSGEVLQEARAVLGEADVGLQSRIVSLTVPRGPPLHSRLRDAHEKLGSGDSMVVLEGETRVRVLVDSANAACVTDTLGVDGEPGSVEPVAVVRLVFSGDRPANLAGVAIALNAFAQQGIDVREVFTCEPQYSIVVDQEDARQAFQAVSKLTSLE